MQKKTWSKILLAVMFAIIPTTSSWAACTLTDLAGTWNVYLAGWDHAGGSGAWWGYGPITVTATGAVKTGSILKMSDPATITVTGGTLRVTSTCTITGTVKSNTGNLTIKNAAMDRGKTTVAGVFQSAGAQDGMLNMIKR